MKLIKASITSYQELSRMMPRITSYLGNKPVVHFSVYTLGALDVFYIEQIDDVDIIIRSRGKRISKQAINFVISKLMPEDSLSDLEIDAQFINKLPDRPGEKYKQIVLIRRKNEMA